MIQQDHLDLPTSRVLVNEHVARMRIAVDVAVDEDHLAVEAADHSTYLKRQMSSNSIEILSYLMLVESVLFEVLEIVDLSAFAEFHR